MSEDRFSAASVALGFILGGVLGASLALIFAPESGRRTRERLKDLAADVREKTRDVTEDIRDKVEEALDQGKEVYEEKKTLLSAAYQAGKEAMQRERERLQTR